MGINMKKAGVIGLGDMGSGLARNLIQSGFETSGFDLLEQRRAALAGMGGHPAGSVAEVGIHADAVFVMVMNGDQVREVILGQEGLVASMKSGGTIILTATIKPSEAHQLGVDMEGCGINIIDSPVSGGYSGAQSGKLTLMAAADPTILDANLDIMRAVSASIHRVGTRAGEGQTVKACLQSLIGPIFAATFETAALAAKAGVSGQVIYDVFSSSGAGCGVVETALENIIDRQFKGTGSHISTMHKDLTIAMDFAEQLEVPVHSAANAMQLFHAGKSRYPEGDNWVCTRIIENLIGAELHR